MYVCPSCKYVVLCCQKICPRCGTLMNKVVKSVEKKERKKSYYIYKK